MNILQFAEKLYFLKISLSNHDDFGVEIEQ